MNARLQRRRLNLARKHGERRVRDKRLEAALEQLRLVNERAMAQIRFDRALMSGRRYFDSFHSA